MLALPWFVFRACFCGQVVRTCFITDISVVPQFSLRFVTVVSVFKGEHRRGFHPFLWSTVFVVWCETAFNVFVQRRVNGTFKYFTVAPLRWSTLLLVRNILNTPFRVVNTLNPLFLVVNTPNIRVCVINTLNAVLRVEDILKTHFRVINTLNAPLRAQHVLNAPCRVSGVLKRNPVTLCCPLRDTCPVSLWIHFTVRAVTLHRRALVVLAVRTSTITTTTTTTTTVTFPRRILSGRQPYLSRSGEGLIVDVLPAVPTRSETLPRARVDRCEFTGRGHL